MFPSSRDANTKICGFAIGYGTDFLRPRNWTSLFPIDSLDIFTHQRELPEDTWHQTEDVSNAKAKRYPHSTREIQKLVTVLLLPKIKKT